MRIRRLPLFATLVVLLASPAFAQKPPDESLKTLRVPDGFEISLFASEPMITNPSAIDIDTHGRVWVAEIQWYRAQAKQPPADKIKVLEDTDGDGVADKVTVFAEGIFAPMSVCVAGDKVYVATSPDLWVYEDKDGDLKADGPPKKLLTGFGGMNHDHGAHSLVLGPDHKWWMSHGDTGFHVTGTDGSQIQFKWGAMLRGELDGSKLETVAVNFRNPYEPCVSSFGECYMSDNDNDGNESVRAGWVMEGGNYGWFGAPPGPKGHVPADVPFSQHWHFRGHIPGYVPATLCTGFGSPCGICFYEGDAFGSKYKNAPLHCDAGPREVRIYRHELAGYGMKATSENIVTTEGDNYFRPDDICTAPDGSLYISDWYDGGVGGHAYNDPDRGRIFRLTPQDKSKLKRIGKPGPFTIVADAIEGLKNPNLATQYLARERLLAEPEESGVALAALMVENLPGGGGKSIDPNLAARALWLLDRIDADTRSFVVDQLGNLDPRFRALAIRILRRHGAEYASQILRFANDPPPEVRREVLLAIRNLDSDASLAALASIAASYDGSDRYQLEAINVAAGDRKPKLFAALDGKIRWSPRNFLLVQVLNPKAADDYLTTSLGMPRIDETIGTKMLALAAVSPSPEVGRAVLKLAADPSAVIAVRQLALQRVDGNLYSVWKDLARDEQLSVILKPLLADKELQSAALNLIGKHSLSLLGGEVLQLAGSVGVDTAIRQRAVAVVAQLRSPGASELLRGLLADEQPAVRQAALTGLVDMQDMKAIKDVLAGTDGKYSNEVQSQTVERLMASSGGALVLFRMIDANTLPARFAAAVVSNAAKHPDANVRVLFEKFIPDDQRPKKLGDVIKPEEILVLKGDVKRGEQIFFQSSAAQCKNCHAVRGQGSTVGPDLSQIGKKYERATLLETILDPSKAIAPEYYTYLVETQRGQVYAGFLAEKSDKQVVIKDSKGELIRIPAKEVVELKKTEKSVMPDLVLRDVPAQDAADLLAYLTTLTP